MSFEQFLQFMIGLSAGICLMLLLDMIVTIKTGKDFKAHWRSSRAHARLVNIFRWGFNKIFGSNRSS